MGGDRESCVGRCAVPAAQAAPRALPRKGTLANKRRLRGILEAGDAAHARRRLLRRSKRRDTDQISVAWGTTALAAGVRNGAVLPPRHPTLHERAYDTATPCERDQKCEARNSHVFYYKRPVRGTRSL